MSELVERRHPSPAVLQGVMSHEACGLWRNIFAPRCQSRRYRSIQAGLADRLHQQHGPGLRDHSTTVTLNADMQVRPDTLLHLRSASFHGAIWTLEKSYRCRSEALLAFVIKPSPYKREATPHTSQRVPPLVAEAGPQTLPRSARSPRARARLGRAYLDHDVALGPLLQRPPWWVRAACHGPALHVGLPSAVTPAVRALR